MKSLSKEKQYDMIDAFNSTSRYLDDLLNIDNLHVEQMVHRIYPAKLQLYKANASDNEVAFVDINLSIHNEIVSTKIYDNIIRQTTCLVFNQIMFEGYDALFSCAAVVQASDPMTASM